MPSPDYQQLDTMVSAVLALETGKRDGRPPTAEMIRAWVAKVRPVFPAVTDIQADALIDTLRTRHQAWD